MTSHGKESGAPQRSYEWYEARMGLVTASNAGAILGLDPNRGPEDVIRSMVRAYKGAQTEFTGNVATEYGAYHEDGAIFDYTLETGRSVDSCGFFKSCTDPWLGASPDGIVSEEGINDQGLIEVKCPFRLRSGEGEHKPLSDQPHYYAQVQVQLYVTDMPWCDFFQWAPHKTMLERIHGDDEWLRENIPLLEEFYQWFLKEADNPDHLSPKREEIDNEKARKLVAEYDEVCDQLDFAQQRKKEILDSLIAMAKDRDAIVCGRKLTKVERAGSVAYAQVVKKHCPGVDLEPFRGKRSISWRIT